jgi:hypothetical protein
MFFILDTWLDNRIPSIRVINKATGQPILEFKGKEVQQLLEEHIIDIEDLYFRDQDVEDENINDLFVYAKQKNLTLQQKLKALVLPNPYTQLNVSALTSTFNRFEYLQKALLEHNSLNCSSI